MGVVISGVVTHITGLITPLIATHEPLSRAPHALVLRFWLPRFVARGGNLGSVSQLGPCNKCHSDVGAASFTTERAERIWDFAVRRKRNQGFIEFRVAFC